MADETIKKTPIALTIAGSDSGGGAGVQADLKAFSANGVFGASAITAVTAQNTTAVRAVHEVPADVVAAQIQAVLSDLSVDAIKIGMLFSPEIIAAVAGELAGCAVPIVLDPVMISKSGDTLLQEASVAIMAVELFPLATLITPNLPEAARLLNQPEAKNQAEMQAQGQALLKLGARAVLMKGGHSRGDICTDILLTREGGIAQLDAPRVLTKNTHGTGCTYSAAIAANLAKGQDLAQAVRCAHDYLQAALQMADRLTIGAGHGPVHHFHAFWGR